VADRKAFKLRQLLFLELNEVNFEFVETYVASGELPNFATFLRCHGYGRTSSETKYDKLEPWIQWVTAHTGLDFAEHGVFRLGDIVDHDIPQIWEELANRGLRVGAISPMNAKHRLADPAFFIPDPWTQTSISAPPVFRRLYDAIAQAVNDNARSRVTMRSLRDFVFGGLLGSSPSNFGRYATLVIAARKKPWNKALFLDLLLADLFIKMVRKTNPHFATIFLNAAAHVQHHYLFNSACYTGQNRNPEWYASADVDPVLEVYRLYDHCLGMILKAFPQARIMLATGLHQAPYGSVTYYWRLKDHAAFLTSIGVPYRSVEPRMSRDFLVRCADVAEADRCAARLAVSKACDGTHLFTIDNRGTDLFVMLTYPGPIDAGFSYQVENEQFEDLAKDVVFVAIKNGEHDGIGYFADSARTDAAHDELFPLRDIPDRVRAAFDVQGAH
jgi:hypothetical protein